MRTHAPWMSATNPSARQTQRCHTPAHTHCSPCPLNPCRSCCAPLSCWHRMLNGSGRAECAGVGYCGGARCAPQCPAGSACGPDGCGGQCGGGCATGAACRAFHCVAASYPYSCQQPAPLLPAGQSLLGEHRLLLDMAELAYADEVAFSCTAYPNADDLAFHFTVPDSLTAGVGVDAWLRGYHNPDVDTVLEIRRQRCSDLLPRTAPAAAASGAEQGDDYVCSDNSEPPGGNSARVVARLPPGSYYLLLSTLPPYVDRAIDGSALSHTAFATGLPANHSDSLLSLQLRFVDGYVQDCRLKECGSDGRQPEGCGVCPPSSHCNSTSFHCQPDHCRPSCAGRSCGDDGCGGDCGRCPAGQGCLKDEGLCMSDDSGACDGRRPNCQPSCTGATFCNAVSSQANSAWPPSSSRAQLLLTTLRLCLPLLCCLCSCVCVARV